MKCNPCFYAVTYKNQIAFIVEINSSLGAIETGRSGSSESGLARQNIQLELKRSQSNNKSSRVAWPSLACAVASRIYRYYYR